MKVKGNEDKLVIGKKYWVSDESDEKALIYKKKNNTAFLRIWTGDKFGVITDGITNWKYAIPEETPKYITAEFSEEYPEWWQNRPILGQVRDYEEAKWSNYYVFCVGVCPGASHKIRIADENKISEPKDASLDNWKGQVTRWAYFKPYVVPEIEEISFEELCKLAGKDPQNVKITMKKEC